MNTRASSPIVSSRPDGAQPPPADVGRAAPSVVYALTSDGLDVHSATMRVSVASLRLSNPGTSVTVVCDAQTDQSIRRTRDPLLSEVDRWVVPDTPDGSAVFRNRFLKTCLRRWLDGPFLYLDADTVIRGSLADVFALDADVGVAANHSRDRIEDQFGPGDIDLFARMGWTIGHRPFVNGGVIYLSDTTPARAFSARWHDNWLASVAVGVTRDQPALNAALDTSPLTVTLLAHRYNAQCRTNPGAAAGAVIDHYYSARAGAPAAAQRLANQIAGGTAIDPAELRALVSRDHPWVRRSWLDDLVAVRIARRGVIEDADEFWLDGRWFDSLAMRVRDGVPFGRTVAAFLRRITGRPVYYQPGGRR